MGVVLNLYLDDNSDGIPDDNGAPGLADDLIDTPDDSLGWLLSLRQFKSGTLHRSVRCFELECRQPTRKLFQQYNHQHRKC